MMQDGTIDAYSLAWASRFAGLKRENEMTKNDKRELNNAVAVSKSDPALAARMLSVLYRSAKGFDRDDIKAVAESVGVRFHSEFITG